jgi:hypothetical protein
MKEGQSGTGSALVRLFSIKFQSIYCVLYTLVRIEGSGYPPSILIFCIYHQQNQNKSPSQKVWISYCQWKKLKAVITAIYIDISGR